MASQYKALSQRATFLLYALGFMLLTTGGTIPIPLYTLWGEELSFDSSMTTWIFSIYVLGTLLALVFFGGISDQVGRKPLIISAFIITLASAGLFLWAGSVTVLLAARFLSGVGVGLITSAATAGLSEAYSGDNDSTPQVVSTVVNMGGLGLGPLLAGVFAEHLPGATTTVFYLFLALTVVATMVSLKIPETNENATGNATLRLNIGVPKNALGIYTLSALAVFPTFTLLGLFSSLTPRFIGQALGVHNVAVGGAATFILFELGVLSQLWGRKHQPRTLILAGLPILLVSLILVLLGVSTNTFPAFVAGTLLGGIGAGLTFSGGLRQLGSAVDHKNHAKAVATYFVVAQAGLAVPVLTIGALTDSLGLNGATVAVLWVVIGLGAVALLANIFLAKKLSPGKSAAKAPAHT